MQTSQAERAFSLISNSENLSLLNAFVKNFSNSFYTSIITARIEELNTRKIKVESDKQKAISEPGKNNRLAKLKEAERKWSLIKSSTDIGVLKEFARDNSDTAFGSIAGSRIDLLGELALLEEKRSQKFINNYNSSQTRIKSAADHWKQLKTSNNIKDLSDFAEKYPDLIYANLAITRIEDLRNAEKKRLEAETEIEKQANKNANLQLEKLDDNHKRFANIDQNVNIKELSRGVQTELNRIGCSVGIVDGVWGKGSRRALEKYRDRAKIELTSKEPTVDLLNSLKLQYKNICPLICKIGFGNKNNECVKMSVEDQIQSPECKKHYKEFRAKRPSVRAFALSVDGNHCGSAWSFETKKSASTGAISECSKNSSDCRVVEISNLANRPFGKVCKDIYTDWQKKRGYKAFAISGTGSQCGWSAQYSSRKKANSGALQECRKRSKGCHIIASRKR